MMRLLGYNLVDRYLQQLPGYMNAVDDAGRKAVKHKKLEKFMAVFFMNAHHRKFGDLLVEHKKSCVTKKVKYLENLGTMMDVIRKQPIKKKYKSTPKKLQTNKRRKREIKAHQFSLQQK